MDHLGCPARWIAFLIVATLTMIGASSAPSIAWAAAANPKAGGFTVRISLPIVGDTVDRTKQFVRRALEKADEEGIRPTLVFEFQVPKDQEDFARRSEFGAALTLAEFLSSEELNRAQTIAYIPQPIQGHAVLVAIACNEIIMAPDASIGPANVDDKVVTESRRGNYRELANRRRTVPAPVALWLLDPSEEVLVVKTEVSREFVSQGELAELRKRHAITSVEKLYDPKNPGESLAAVPGRLTGKEARELDVAKYLADARAKVAKALDLPAASLDEDPSLVGRWNAVRVDMKGPINDSRVAEIANMIDRQVEQDGINFVCLWIDSPGGSLDASIRLANHIQGYEGNNVRVVAYVPAQARSDAALVALACRQLVIDPRAVLGGPGTEEFSPEDIRQAVVALSDPTGPWSHRSWSLVAAMIDPKLAVFRYTQPGEGNEPGETAYFSDLEREAVERNHREAKPWQKHEQITFVGRPLQLSGDRAKQLGLASREANSFQEFREIYGLEHEPRLLEPNWASAVVEALASPAAAAVLLMIGFVALYVELHTPGLGAGAFIATVCFVLFFWSRFLGQTANTLEVTLFVVGVCFLLLEFLVLPGFGIFGFGGGVLVLVSLILASQTFALPRNEYQFAQLQQSMMTIAGAAAGFLAVAFILRTWLPKTPMLSHVFLPPPEGEEAETISRREAMVFYNDLLGERGTTTTQLTPSGKARFGDRLVDVISDGDLVPRGSAVEIVAVKGNRVIVRVV